MTAMVKATSQRGVGRNVFIWHFGCGGECSLLSVSEGALVMDLGLAATASSWPPGIFTLVSTNYSISIWVIRSTSGTPTERSNLSANLCGWNILQNAYIFAKVLS